MPAPQASWFILTIRQEDFSPTDLPDARYSNIRYFKGQLERGSQNGFLHWQAVVYVRKRCTITTLKRVFPTAHIEITRSAAANEYVWKEDTRVGDSQVEWGTKPHRRNNPKDWAVIWEAAQRGNLEEIPEDVRFHHYRTIRTICADYSKPVGVVKTIHVYWGDPGTGKSKRAWEQAGMDAYPKDPRTKWWCGYRGHENVVIDEFRGDIDICHMLRWMDRYPVLVEIKGSSVPLKAKQIWITSNLAPKDWYPNVDPVTLQALLRRIKVTHFANLV